MNNGHPAIPRIGGGINLFAGGAKVYSAWIDLIHCHSAAYNINEAIARQQAKTTYFFYAYRAGQSIDTHRNGAILFAYL